MAKMMISTIVLATQNRDKIKELRAIFAEFSVQVLTMEDFPGFPDVEETGKTLAENALLKAQAIHKFCAMPTIADDTGLEVDALNGAPGVYAARYAGEDATYADNVNKLLREMQNIKDRTARFVTATTFVNSEQKITALGKIEGVICKTPKGSAGFGYDSIFFVPGINKTFAEMSAEEKNLISHRSRSLRALIEKLQSQSIISNKQGVPIVR